MPSLRRSPNPLDAIRLAERRKRYAPSTPCENCGSTDDLVWDHKDPTSKFRDVARMIQSYSDTVIQRELAKCRVLCRSCNTKKSRITNRITDRQLRRVLKLIGEGYDDQEIALFTKVGRGTVWRIRNGESWNAESST